ncbi:hypothetical protein ACIRF8_02265 [Streptomyces sp. NPDC102406]
MGDLLASCAAARAVSTPPRPHQAAAPRPTGPRQEETVPERA